MMIDVTQCTGCSACAAVCPQQAISFTVNTNGFLYPGIDKDICTDCGLCSRVCRADSSQKATEEKVNLISHEKIATQFYAFQGNKSVREKSTSGGLFQLAAIWILAQGGVVYGAAYDSVFHVRHRRITETKELKDLLGTRYVQSDAGDTFGQVKEDLNQLKKVLYVADPCMAEGLLSFLSYEQTDCSELILMDHICNGVPSPILWESYAAYLGKGGSLKDFSFRAKVNPDCGHTVCYTTNSKQVPDEEFPENKEQPSGYMKHIESMTENRYCRIYMKNLGLRPSCYSCKYCTTKRDTDITIGDFWGVEQVCPGLEDGYGTSLVLVHTKQGRMLLQNLITEGEKIRKHKEEQSQNLPGNEKENVFDLLSVQTVKEENAMQPRLQFPPKQPVLNRVFLMDMSKLVNGADLMETILKKFGA